MPPRVNRRLVALGSAGLLAIAVALALRGRLVDRLGKLYLAASGPEYPLTRAEHTYITRRRARDMAPPGKQMVARPFEITVHGNSDPVMESVTLINGGDAVAGDLWLFRDGQPNFYSAQTLVESVTRAAQSKLDKVMALWNLFPRFYYNCVPDLQGGVADEPNTLLAVFGTAQCNNACAALAKLCQLLDCDTRRIGIEVRGKGTSLLAHMTLEVKVGDRWIYLDPDGHVFYRTADRLHVAGVDALLADPALVARTRHPVYDRRLVARAFREKGVRTYPSSMEAFGKLPLKERELDPAQYTPHRHLMRFCLLPGAAAEITWKKQGKCLKYHKNGRVLEPPLYSNGLMRCELDTTRPATAGLFCENVRFEPSGGGLRLSRKERDKAASFIVPVVSPYAIVGGRVTADFVSNRGQHPRVFFCPALTYEWQNRANRWELLWPSGETESYGQRVHISLDRFFPRPMFAYFIKVEVPRDGAVVRRFSIETDVQCAPEALPRLRVGENRLWLYAPKEARPARFTVTYHRRADHTIATVSAGNGLRIIFSYVEQANHAPRLLRASSRPVRGDVRLTWRFDDDDGDDVTAYHLQVSTRDHFLSPLAPNFDLETTDAGLTIGKGWLNAGRTYYWRVKARDAEGHWSRFSRTFSFTYEPAAPAHP